NSGPPPAVPNAAGVQDAAGNNVLFYIASNQAMYENASPAAGTGGDVLVGSWPFRQLSAGLSPGGVPAVAAVDIYGGVWLAAPGAIAWTRLATSGFSQVAIDLQGNIVGVDTTGQVWLDGVVSGQYTGWAKIGSVVCAVAAGDHVGGAMTFFALDGNGNLWQYTAGGAGWLQLTQGGGFVALTADPQGDLYALDRSNGLWLRTAGGSFVQQAPSASFGGVTTTFAAGLASNNSPLVYGVTGGVLYTDAPVAGQPAWTYTAPGP